MFLPRFAPAAAVAACALLGGPGLASDCKVTGTVRLSGPPLTGADWFSFSVRPSASFHTSRPLDVRPSSTPEAVDGPRRLTRLALDNSP
jgi:hypothetical protein